MALSFSVPFAMKMGHYVALEQHLTCPKSRMRRTTATIRYERNWHRHDFVSQIGPLYYFLTIASSLWGKSKMLNIYDSSWITKTKLRLSIHNEWHLSKFLNGRLEYQMALIAHYFFLFFLYVRRYFPIRFRLYLVNRWCFIYILSSWFCYVKGAAVVEGAERGEVMLNAFAADDGEEKRVEFRCPDAHWLSMLSQRIVDSHS